MPCTPDLHHHIPFLPSPTLHPRWRTTYLKTLIHTCNFLPPPLCTPHPGGAETRKNEKRDEKNLGLGGWD